MIEIRVGDCRELLRELPDESVNCIVTSPPYWNLRDYGVAGQIGLEETVDEWAAELVSVFREARRVLRPDGVTWVNLGDSYSGKSLVGQPWRVAFALKDDGWLLRSEVVWHKANPMPESVSDRPTKAHEQVFMLTRSERYWYDAAAVAEQCSPNTHERYAQAAGKPFGMTNWARDGGDHSAVAHSRREIGIGRNARPRKGAPNGSGTKNNASFDAAMAKMPETRNVRTVWTFPTEGFSEPHFATFPTELARRCILAACPAGGVVLDPFGGAGTTGLVADRLGRDAILLELNPEYAEMARRRIRNDAPLFAEVA